MFYRRDTAKRLFAMGGVALSLIACLQQSHALCRLVCCQNRLLTATTVVVEPGRVTNCGGCCDESSESPRPDAPCHPPSDDGIPCGPQCWCCQSADPREAPRNVTESVKSRVSMHFVCPSCTNSINSQADCENVDTTAAHQFSARSSGETCVRLCRFLT